MKQVPQTAMHTPCWIGPANWQDQVKPDVQHPYALRKVITIDKPITRAMLNITGAWRYNLWINGTFVNHGPARCFPEHMLYDELDISAYLHVGENVIAVLLIPSPGVPGYTPVTRSGLWIDGSITCGDNHVPVVSDTSWQIRKADWINFHHLFISLAVGQQEHFDAQREIANWKSDPTLDPTGWQTPMLLGTHPTPPWWNLSPRPHHLLTEQPICGRHAWEGQTTTTISECPVNPAKAFNAMSLLGQFVCDDDQPMIALKPGQIITLDFGHTQLIRPGLKISQSQSGSKLLLYYDIAIKDRPTAMRGFGTEREGFCDSLTLSDSDLHWHAMLPRGFRFLTFTNIGNAPVTFLPDCHVITYPFDEPKTPAFDDSFLNDIWQTSIRTLRSSCFDSIVDTCSREQMCWTLDACLAGEAAHVTFGETKLWRRCLQLIAQGIDAHGCPHAVVPSDVSFMVLFDQTMYWLVSCHRYVQRTGDNTLLAEIAMPAERFLALCASHMTEENLFVPPNYSWHFVDWAPIPRHAYSMPINAMLLWASDAACSLYDSPVGKALSSGLRHALPRFYDDEQGCYRNHLQPKCDVAIQGTFNHTQDNATHGVHANALALQVGLSHQTQVTTWLLDMLKTPEKQGSRMGPGWVEIILGPLVERGHGDAVVECIKATFGKLTDQKVPTWPEGFVHDATANTCYNTAHAWGSVVNVLLMKIDKQARSATIC